MHPTGGILKSSPGMYCLMVMFFHVILLIHYYSWYIVTQIPTPDGGQTPSFSFPKIMIPE
jgi:hypothetical protein